MNSASWRIAVLWLGIAAVTVAGPAAAATADFAPLRRPPRDLILGFDLADEQDLAAVVLLALTPGPAPAMRSFTVPFRVREARAPEGLFVTWGAFQTSSVFTFIALPDRAGPHDLLLTPAFSEAPEDFVDVASLRSGLYLVRRGLERYFVLDVRPSDLEAQAFAALAGRLELDGVAVALPRGAVGIAIEGTQTARPPAAESHGRVHFFSAAGTVPARVEVRYRVPPTSLQKLILKWGLKLVGVLLVPLASLILLQREDLHRPGMRRVALFVLPGLQLLALVLFWVVVSQVRWAAAEDPVADFVVALAGALAQMTLLLVKTTGRGAAPPPR